MEGNLNTIVEQLVNRVDLVSTKGFEAARQAVFVDGITTLIWTGLSVGAILLVVKFLLFAYREPSKDPLDVGEKKFFSGAGICLCGIAAIIVFGIGITGLNQLLAPNWYAMKALLNSIPR